jgi:hypothetical protein
VRPQPSEIIGAVRGVLKEVRAQVATEAGRARLDEVRAVLAQVDWDDAGFELATRTRDLASVLDDIAAWRDRDPARCAALPELEPVLLPAEQTYAGHQAAYVAAARAVVALVVPMAEWLADHPCDREAAGLHARLVAAV